MSIAGSVAKLLVAAVVDELRGVVRRAWRGLKGKAPHAEPSQPWTYKDVRHVDDMIDAGAENHRVTQMRPPPPSRRR